MHIEEIQEGEYDFPYHHLVSIGPFSEAKHLFWGYKYAAYLEKILDTLAGMPFTSLIDIGCGDGKMAYEIKRRFPERTVAGVDYSEKSLRFARAFSPEVAFSASTDDTFDAFVMIEVIEHIDPVEMGTFLDSICRNLAPGAIGIISTPCDNVPVLEKHFQHFNEASITKTLSSHFQILSLEYTSATGGEVGLMQRLLANRFFILNYRPLVELLYARYKRKYLHATKENATQLFLTVKRK